MNCLARALVLACFCLGSGATASGASAVENSSDGRRPAAAAQASGARDVGFQRRVRAALHEVMTDREFADLRVDSGASSRRLYEWFQSLFEGLASLIKRLPGWLAWGIVVWMVLTLLAILAHLIYTLATLLGGISQPSRTSGPRHGHPALLLGLPALDFDATYAEARRMLGEGDWPAATKYFYVAAILWLDRQGCIVFRQSKTNRDYIQELRARERLQAGFRWLTGCFEPIVYGGQSATPSTTQDMADRVEELLHEPASSVAS